MGTAKIYTRSLILVLCAAAYVLQTFSGAPSISAQKERAYYGYSHLVYSTQNNSF